MQSDEATQLGQFIPLHYHHHMLGDDARTSAFKSALGYVVPIGGRVLELGSGTGVLSFFAAQRADQVIAVEYNPALVRASRIILAQNGVEDKVTVVQGDASTFIPEAPVDVVVCEMLHSALLREKQLEVIRKFKSRYAARFGTLPRFVPEATILAAQPLSQDYDYQGYKAAVPLFQDAGVQSPRSRDLSDPISYGTIDYREALPEQFEETMRFVISDKSEVNAIRFITKNLLAILPDERRSIDWYNQHLVLPLQSPIPAEAGDTLEIRFTYNAGGPIEMLSESLRSELVE
jgi:protein arginine N-methyltransferase 1